MGRACWLGSATKLSVPLPNWQHASHRSGQSCIRPACIKSQLDTSRSHSRVVRLPNKVNHSEVFVFGVEHETLSKDPANFILESKPAAVVFENSFSAAGGNGAVVNCIDCASQDGSATIAYLCSVAAQLRGVANVQHHSWWQEAGAALDVEMLAHVAAFIVDARVVHADRPVRDKFLRLYSRASLQDLDAAVGAQACINYADMLGHSLQHADLRAATVVHHIHITERDALICSVLERAASQQSGPVVGVVGADHLQGICSLWAAASHAQYARKQQQSQALDLAAAEESSNVVGARRALFERFFELSSSPATCAALQQFLPPLPAEAVEAFELTTEIYGSHRMMLASLCRQDLTKVCSGCNCNMWEVLAPVRALRPVNGGIGFDADVAIELRQLMFEL